LGSGARQAAAHSSAHWWRRAGTSMPTVRYSGVQAHFTSKYPPASDWFELPRRCGVWRDGGENFPRCWRPCAAARTWFGSTTAPTAWCPRSGCGGLGCWQERVRRKTGHIRFRRSQARAAGCAAGHANPRPTATRRSRKSVRNCACSRASRPPCSPPVSWVAYAITSARGWAGWGSCAASLSGGCLADDMGVGKTAQVLALFETRREFAGHGGECRPVAGGRSAVAGFQTGSRRRRGSRRDCACSITTGPERNGDDFAAYRRNPRYVWHVAPGTPVRLKDVEFDYVVLDEAQAVKNSDTESAKGRQTVARSSSSGAQWHTD